MAALLFTFYTRKESKEGSYLFFKLLNIRNKTPVIYYPSGSSESGDTQRQLKCASGLSTASIIPASKAPTAAVTASKSCFYA
jgi:hypothetical protein